MSHQCQLLLHWSDGRQLDRNSRLSQASCCLWICVLNHAYARVWELGTCDTLEAEHLYLTAIKMNIIFLAYFCMKENLY